MKPIFDARNLCTDICKTIFVILEVQFHHERGLSETRYFELFFSTWSRLSPYQKSASAEAPFNLFWTLTMILAIFAFWKSYEIFWYKIWVIIFTKSAKLSDLGIPWLRNNRLLLDFFWTFKTLLDTLTYSALNWTMKYFVFLDVIESTRGGWVQDEDMWRSAPRASLWPELSPWLVLDGWIWPYRHFEF